MGLRNILAETRVLYDSDYIVFACVMEDVWSDDRYTYEIIMYEPITLINGETVKHPFAYRNAEKELLFRYSVFGHRTFANADDRMNEVLDGLMTLINGGMTANEVAQALNRRTELNRRK